MSEYIVEGEVLINGQLSGIEHIKKLSGYVQQGDCFVPMLTVREHLVFHVIYLGILLLQSFCNIL